MLIFNMCQTPDYQYYKITFNSYHYDKKFTKGRLSLAFMGRSAP